MDNIISVKDHLIDLVNNIKRDESFLYNNIELTYLYYSLIYLIFEYFELFTHDTDNFAGQIKILNKFKDQLRSRISSSEDIHFMDFVVSSFEQELNTKFDLKLASQKINEAKEYANISNEVYTVGLEILGNCLKDILKYSDVITEKLYMQNFNFMKYELLMDNSKS